MMVPKVYLSHQHPILGETQLLVTQINFGPLRFQDLTIVAGPLEDPPEVKIIPYSKESISKFWHRFPYYFNFKYSNVTIFFIFQPNMHTTTCPGPFCCNFLQLVIFFGHPLVFFLLEIPLDHLIFSVYFNIFGHPHVLSVT